MNSAAKTPRSALRSGNEVLRVGMQHMHMHGIDMCTYIIYTHKRVQDKQIKLMYITITYTYIIMYVYIYYMYIIIYIYIYICI